jgi:hypothetical protein
VGLARGAFHLSRGQVKARRGLPPFMVLAPQLPLSRSRGLERRADKSSYPLHISVRSSGKGGGIVASVMVGVVVDILLMIDDWHKPRRICYQYGPVLACRLFSRWGSLPPDIPFCPLRADVTTRRYSSSSPMYVQIPVSSIVVDGPAGLVTD